MFLFLDQFIFNFLICQQLLFNLGEFVEFLIDCAHFLDYMLHLTCVLKFALDKLTFQALLYLRSQAQLIVNAFVFIKKALHV